MAKDPAVLWYWNDWHGGTCTLSRFLKGCYMDLLHAQFNNGNLSLDEIKTVLGSDFGSSWPTLQKKFKADDKGLFFNERLVTESVKRKTFTKSRRDNLKGVSHMAPHMENEDDNVNEIKNTNVKLFFEDKNFEKTWKNYHEMRKKIRKPMTAEAEKLILNKLEKLSCGTVTQAILILSQSIENSWQGVFPIKEVKGASASVSYTAPKLKPREKELTKQEIDYKNEEAENLKIEMLDEQYQKFLKGEDINDSFGFLTKFLTEKGKMNGSISGVFEKIKKEGSTVKEYLK